MQVQLLNPSSLIPVRAKVATLGFGGVLAAGSIVLRRVFTLVATAGSSSFVAASLLVSCGLGVLAENFGLSATTGAFAAGVLLARVPPACEYWSLTLYAMFMRRHPRLPSASLVARTLPS